MAKTTNKAQYQRLFQLMSENPDLAQGFTKLAKEEVHNFWEKVKVELNCLGPPNKDAAVWKKVWFDWKSYIKRKLTENKTEIKATGGGEYKQHSFSKLEEALIQLTGLQTSTSGIKNTISFGNGIPSEIENTTQTNNQIPQSHENTAELIDVSMSSDQGATRRNISRKVDDTANLLRQQLDAQKIFYLKTEKFYEDQAKVGEDLAFNTKRIYRALDKLCDLKNKQMQETMRHSKVQEELLEQKVEIKLKMLQMEETKLNLHELG